MHSVRLRLLADSGDEAVVVRIERELATLQVRTEMMDATMGGQELGVERNSL